MITCEILRHLCELWMQIGKSQSFKTQKNWLQPFHSELAETLDGAEHICICWKVIKENIQSVTVFVSWRISFMAIDFVLVMWLKIPLVLGLNVLFVSRLFSLGFKHLFHGSIFVLGGLCILSELSCSTEWLGGLTLLSTEN